jgi:hypothetical protein
MEGGAAGIVITVTDLVWLCVPQLLVTVYIIVTVPVATPVTTPVEGSTEAIEGSTVPHEPPAVASVRVVVAPTHTFTAEAGAIAATAEVSTVIDFVALPVPQVLVTL